MKTNYKTLDIFKFICALLVISIHTYPLLTFSKTANFYVSLVIGRIAVPFFFVCSAFFLFKKLNISCGIKSKYNSSILKNYLIRLLKLYIIWCILYFPFTIITWINNGFGISDIVVYLRNFIFAGGCYHLWFLPAMAFSTIIVYLLIFNYRSNTKIVKICLSLYVIGAVINIFGNNLMQIPVLSSIIRVYDAIFTTTRNGIFFAPIFTFMGYYIARNDFNDNKRWLSGAILISLIALLLEASLYHYVFKIDNDLISMYISLVPLMFYLFNLLIKVNLKTRINGRFLRQLSTLMYLAHIGFVDILYMLNTYLNWNNLMIYLVVVVLTLFLSTIIVLLSDRFKILKELY